MKIYGKFETYLYTYVLFMEIIIISLLLLVCQSLAAQHVLTKEANVPQVGDRLRPLQVELPKDAYDEELHLWDFNRMQSLEKNSRQRYMMTGDSVRHHTARIEDGQRAYYDVKGDSLLLTGHENRLTKMMYDEPELFLHFPMQLGDSIEGYFHGRGTYCNRIALHNYGRYKTKAIEHGSMVLPEGDTLKHVLLIHTERIIGEQYYPDIHHDSIRVYTTDSIMSHLQTDSTLTISCIDRWYAAGYRYPVLERRQEYIKDSTEDSTEQSSDNTLYNAPYLQKELEDEYNASLREILVSNSVGNDGDNNDSKNDNESIIDNITVTVSGKTVTVSFDLTADTTVRALVCNVLGVVYRQEIQTGHAGEHCQMQVYCGGLSAGNYVLHLQVNGKTVFSSPCNL